MASKLEAEAKRFVSSYANKKGLRWRVSLPDGRGGQVRAQGFLTESRALEFAIAEYKKIILHTGEVATQFNSKITFREYAIIWMDFKIRNGIADNTKLRYSDLIEKFLNPFFGNLRLNELDKRYLRNYIRDCQVRGISTYNVNSTVTLLKSIIRQAVEDDYIPMAGLLMIRTPKHRAKDPEFWDQTEMRFFLNAAKNSKWFNLFKFVLWTGLRAGEVAALRWDSIFLDRKFGPYVGCINIHRTCAQKTLKIRETTKNGDRRTIPIFPELRELIVEMKATARGDYVFGGEIPMDPSHFARLLRQELRKIPQLKPINFHGLRHTFCSYLDSTGMNRRIVSEIMGHRDLTTTDRYSHVSNQALGYEVSRWVHEQSQQNSNKILEVAL